MPKTFSDVKGPSILRIICAIYDEAPVDLDVNGLHYIAKIHGCARKPKERSFTFTGTCRRRITDPEIPFSGSFRANTSHITIDTEFTEPTLQGETAQC